MARVPVIIPISDLRQDAASVVKRVKASNEPIVITQRGRAAAIMVSPEAYETAEKERQILLALANGEKDIAADRGVDLDVAFRKVDEVISNARGKKKVK